MQCNPCLMSKAANAIEAEMKLNFSLIQSLLFYCPAYRSVLSTDHASKKLTMMCHHHRNQSHTSQSWTCRRGPSHPFVIVVRPSAAGPGRPRAGPSVRLLSAGCCMSTERMLFRFSPLTKPDRFPVFVNAEEPRLDL